MLFKVHKLCLSQYIGQIRIVIVTTVKNQLRDSIAASRAAAS